MQLLESAVSRQLTGFDGILKYPGAIENAATLLFGICNDHPFHNGNKRTALVATLAHLDCNRLVLHGAKERELLRFMVSVADHKIVEERVKKGRDYVRIPRRGTSDEEVAAIASWLAARTQRITRGEHPITYRELRRILSHFGFEIANPRNMKVSICRRETKRQILRQPKVILKPVLTIDWPSDGRLVATKDIKRIRRELRLCEEDGIDSEAFYGSGVRVDAFINQYRTVLRRLADR